MNKRERTRDMAEHWKQLLIDWERSARDAELLDLHLRDQGCSEVERKLIAAIGRHGQDFEHEGLRVHSRLECPVRRLAKLATLSLGGVSKAKGRLVDRGVLEWKAGVWRVSWPRIWSMGRPDALPARASPDQGGAFTDVHECSHLFTRPQEKEIYTYPRSKNQTKPRSTTGVMGGDVEPVAIGMLVDEAIDPDGRAARDFEAEVARLADWLLRRLGAIERRLELDDEDRLSLSTARRIAGGVCNDADSDTVDELERVLGSLGRKQRFDRSPAAYLVACAKRRGWGFRRRHEGVTAEDAEACGG